MRVEKIQAGKDIRALETIERSLFGGEVDMEVGAVMLRESS